jgi:hypothetical protein
MLFGIAPSTPRRLVCSSPFRREKIAARMQEVVALPIGKIYDRARLNLEKSGTVFS